MKGPAQPDRTIVLVGGGHAHVHVLAAFGRKPMPGFRIVLVARDLLTPYSGMLPGMIAGHHGREEGHIDLVALTAANGAALIHASATGIDRRARRLLLDDGRPVDYDLLSIDVGAAPATDAIEGARDHALAVKPIGGFMAGFDEMMAQFPQSNGPRSFTMVGGGAGGVELLLSLRHRLLTEAERRRIAQERLRFALVTSGSLLETHNNRVRDAFRRAFCRQGVSLYEDSAVKAIDATGLCLADGRHLESDVVFLATNAAAPAWLAGTGLALDEKGFLAVGPTLQALNDPDVFAAGDCAALTASPREKAGVYAVRAGPPLAANLRRHALGLALEPWHPQRRHLALIGTGPRHAVASRGSFKAEGRWVWHWKNWTDRRWIENYQRPRTNR